jgi:hypothetical protein
MFVNVISVNNCLETICYFKTFTNINKKKTILEYGLTCPSQKILQQCFYANIRLLWNSTSLERSVQATVPNKIVSMTRPLNF